MPTNLSGQNLTIFPTFSKSETQIVLDQNALIDIPPIIGEYSTLSTLYVRNNKIATIAKEIGNLSNLTTLLLSNNEISELPEEIGNLRKLTQLRLDNNKLQEIPKEIGNLTNLVHLFLSNNQITSIPPELKNLTKLAKLTLEGNSITLPQDYNPNNPQATIAFLLDQQKELALKESIIIKKAFYFINASKTSVQKIYELLLEKIATEKEIEFIKITSLEDLKSIDTNVVFLIAPIDSYNNENYIFEIAEKCRTQSIKFFILLQNGLIGTDIESINLQKGSLFDDIVAKSKSLYAENCKTFNSYLDLDNLMFEALKQHKPNVRLTKLTLNNIGHFTNLEVPFDNNLTCLIGENGTGKSTILRALAISIIGHDHKRIFENAKKTFLKIQGLKDDNLIYQEGNIRLEYTIDGDAFFNELLFKPDDNGNDITITSLSKNQLIFGKYNLKSLIVGFPQARGNENIGDFTATKLTQPHINDLIPLVNNTDDYRLRSFAGWIANLYLDSTKKTESDSNEKKLITEAFSIISQITKREIKFLTIKSVDPPEVWVSTYDSPNGVPLSIVSQGFKIIIGWIGYLLQRFANTFPLSDIKSSFKENAILILDEVDTSIHPLWQSSFLDILQRLFPNTQFIFTTHSPLMISGLNKEQFIELTFNEGEIIALKNQTDTWAYNYQDILNKLFDTPNPQPKKTVEELEKLLENSTDISENISIKENIERLKESEIFENDLVKYEASLIKKQQELDTLIEEFKQKLK